MIINLSPVFSNDPTDTIEASVIGSAITINGESFDFGILKKGHMLPAAAVESPHFSGPVVRHDNGELEVTLRLLHPYNASENMKFPVPITVEAGEVPFPQNTTVEEEEEGETDPENPLLEEQNPEVQDD